MSRFEAFRDTNEKPSVEAIVQPLGGDWRNIAPIATGRTTIHGEPTANYRPQNCFAAPPLMGR
jgi:hypothetical protein